MWLVSGVDEYMYDVLIVRLHLHQSKAMSNISSSREISKFDVESILKPQPSNSHTRSKKQP